MSKKNFDVIVIGAGHAGIEAACGAARTGATTLLVTKKFDNLGEMSCNPAIGGVAKGTIVREIDALDGVMGRAIDIAGIHFKTLNESKGPAVHSPRAQADRNLYKVAIRQILRQDYGVDFSKNTTQDNSKAVSNERFFGLNDAGKMRQKSGVLMQDEEENSHCAKSTKPIFSNENDLAKNAVGENNSCEDLESLAQNCADSSLNNLAKGVDLAQKKLEIIFDSVIDLTIENGEVKGVVLENGGKIIAKSVILTAGTFLNGVIHIGDEKISAGRVGEAPSTGISERLDEFDFALSRLKTGTPPRILKSSIDFSILEEQKGDESPIPFSYLNNAVGAPQTSCFITYTNKKTHEIIQKNLEKSAMYGGHVASKGPRYCPSIEDKIFRFASKDRHQIFLEPEGIEESDFAILEKKLALKKLQKNTLQNIDESNVDNDLEDFKKSQNNDFSQKQKQSPLKARSYDLAKNSSKYKPYELIYPNGISTSLPAAKQLEFLRTIKGLENCEMVQAGYAIEYDFVDPREILPTLETKKIRGLFFAGQINGTTGYEEAGGQGLVAGVNAALNAKNRGEFKLDRATSYIGVMIDDLTTLGVAEPYRMLTSRAEYRLSLRADNADFRLTQKGIDVGCVSNFRKSVFLAKQEKLNQAKEILRSLKISPKKLLEKGVKIKQDGIVRNGFELLSFAEINGLAKNSSANSKDPLQKLREIFGQKIDEISSEIQRQVAIEGLYAPYLKRQEQDVAILRQDEAIKIPLNINYDEIKGLSTEVREKLNQARPQNIGAALRIQGVTPAAAMAVVVYLRTN